MHLHPYVPRPPRGKEFGEAIRLMPVDLAPLRVRREHSDSLGNHGVLAAGGVQQRWLDWGSRT